VLAGLALTLTASTALADPTPSDDDVRRAQEAVDDAAASVAAMETELAGLAAADEAAQVAVQAAGEVYAEALETSRQADAEALTAAAEKESADASVAQARAQLVQTARQLSTTSGSPDALTALLAADDFEDMAERTAQLQHVTGRNDQIVQEFLAAQTVAATMDQRAKETAAAAATAKADAETALGEAQQAAAAAQTSLAAGQERRDELVAALATARNTSVEVQRARQAAIDAAREAQAQADAGKTSRPPASGGSSAGSASGGETAVAWARTQIGKPYLWAAAGPDSYDCSGLVQQAWRQAGVSLPHSSRMQYTRVKKVSLDDLRVGDLVFWASDTSDPSTIYHVALWIGSGTVLEAPAPGMYIRTAPLKYTNLMPYGGRP